MRKSLGKHTTVVGVATVTEVVGELGQGIYENALYFLLSFARNLKLL